MSRYSGKRRTHCKSPETKNFSEEDYIREHYRRNPNPTVKALCSLCGNEFTAIGEYKRRFNTGKVEVWPIEQACSHC